MRFTEGPAAGPNVIRSYGHGELRINNQTYGGALIVSATAISPLPEVHSVEELLRIDPARILALDPELVLLGTGARQVFPAPSFGARFLSAGIGFEVMDTGAACRTYNVLVAEQRPVVAVLLA